MAEEKKFLDQNGVEYLWSQLSLEDYPNNETLIAVLNAIDTTKADKEYVDNQADNSVKKYFLIIETIKEGANYLLDGITFDEINEKFSAGNVNMVCHVDGTDYIPLLSVTSSSIIFSGIYNTTSVSLVFNSEGVGTLNTTYLMQNGSLSNYYTKTEVDRLHNNLDDTKADKNDVKQSDWNENDSTSAAYVQNRTHYEYSGNVFTQEINLDYLDNSGAVTFIYGSQEGDMNFPLVEGYSYNITIEAEGMNTFISENNVCFNYDDNGSLAIGDPSLLQREISPLITEGVQTFTYGQVNGNYILRLTAVGVSAVGEPIAAKITIEENAFLKPLDEKFIPDTIARKDYVNSQVAALVNSAPETLDTLGELATALQENQEVVDVLNEAITNKYSADNPPPYPVTSVQGKTGEITFTTETWTFTLTNGTTVTKTVMLA